MMFKKTKRLSATKTRHVMMNVLW